MGSWEHMAGRLCARGRRRERAPAAAAMRRAVRNLAILWVVFCLAAGAAFRPALVGAEEPGAASAASVPTGAMMGAGQAIVIGPDGKPTPLPGAPGERTAEMRGGPEKGAPGKPGKGEGPPGKEGEKKDAGSTGPAVIKRPEKPPVPPSPQELDVVPDKDGRIRFSFRGQPWPEVLDWLARISRMSLDWQELPGDYLNLTTQRSYTVEEARDLINWHLLARGFTLLENGELLTVSSIAKIDPGMIPRVALEELDQRRPHEYVKVSFELDWLMAEAAAEELKPMLSPNGKLTPLKTTNRLEAMDAVENLRQIYAVLKQEQSRSGQERLVREFVLQHARASDVLTQLETLLGSVKKPAMPVPMNPQQMEMMQQQARMMAEQQQQQMQMQQRGARPPSPAAKRDEEVNLVVNPRRNSILANAPPDKMAIIEQAIKAIDVPSDRRDSLITNPNRMQVYRLHALDPQPLVKTLQEIGELDPSTRLEADSKNRAIIAYASLADHVVLRQLIDRLDGSERKFEVIRLRRLAADYVAGSIEFMMAGQKEQEERPRYFFDYYSPRRNEEQTQDKFRVDADVENNRLLLWANEVEIQEVMHLLVKLGELPPEGGRPSTFRVLDPVPEEEASELFERIRKAWPSLAPNPLHVPQEPKAEERDKPPELPQRPASPPVSRETAAGAQVARSALALVAMPGADPEETGPAQPPLPAVKPPGSVDTRPSSTPPGVPDPHSLVPGGGAASPPPVNIEIGPDGRLLVTSQDAAALDLLEELIAQLMPPQPDFKVFRLQYADAYWVTKNLEEFFKEDEDKGRGRGYFDYYYYDYPPPRKEESKKRLSKRPKLKFIYDYDTNSILVQGADPRQLKTIASLIEIYDKPEAPDAQTVRVHGVFHVRYSKAEVIAEAVKDVYRDLLSANDKALAQNPNQRERMSSQTTFIIGDSSGNEPGRTQAKFKGKLSIGVDTVSNTLLVSAEGESLLKSVGEMIQTLDEASRPMSAVSVVRVDGNVNAARVREVLSKVLAEGSASAGQGRGSTPPRGPQQPGNRGGRSGQSSGRRGSG